uniref:Caspase family p20 domain-containing protein n=1 Tax=Amphimedon queenslandica TaxID=400682 RepID=A0A1X7T440_AMPQE
MRTIKELLQEEKISKDINILVIGRTGQGKSALVNSLIELGEEIVAEGALTGCCTTTSQSYTYPNIIPGVSVTIIDTPGLQDNQDKEHKYIQEMKNECSEISLVLYCMKMTNHKFTNDDKVAIKKFHHVFGQKFWERVVFVLTLANSEFLKKWDDRDQDDKSREPKKNETGAWERLKKERLTGRVQHRKEQLNTFVTELLQLKHKSEQSQDVAQTITFEALPAGYYDPEYDNNLRGINWQRDLIAFCCKTIKHKHKLSKLKMNKKIALAVIIDNHGDAKVENVEAAALTKAFENLEFAVLYFNSLSSKSIATLLEAISKADYSQLLMITLVFFSKGKTPELYDADGVVVPYEDVFCHFQKRRPIPVIFFFDSASNDDEIHLQKDIDSTLDDANESHSTVADTQNDNDFNLPLRICPQNSLVLVARHNSASSPVVKEFTEKLSHTSVQECFETICANNNSTTVKSIWHDTVGDNLFIVKSINDSVETLEQKLEVYHSIWYPIRCKTIDRIEESKEEIMRIVNREREARLATTVSGMVASSGLVITGIALAPITFGGSLAISALGGVVGAAMAGAGIGASIVAKVRNNKKLKKAQEHIYLDQQISLMINEDAYKYNKKMPQHMSHVPKSAATSALQGGAAIGRGAAAGVAIGLEGAVEAAAAAFRVTGRVAGAALAGASLAVTIPIDIGMVAYHSYHIHKSKKDPTGKNASSEAVKILYNQLETLFKGMCHAINEVEREVQSETNVLKDDEYGYEIHVPVKENKKLAVTVRTLFSGPFVYPHGYTLVSAVYDITMPELPQPATIKLEHCVDESDQTRSDLCFAIGSVDLKEKKIIFEKVDQECESIQRTSSCLLCILYRRAMQDKTSVNYVAQCFYEKKYKNFWTLNIVFTKFLYANLKYVQSRFSLQGSYFPFVFDSSVLSLDLTCFKVTNEFSGWIISPNDSEEMPDTISIQEIDTAELREGSAKVLKNAFPSISLYVYILNEETAAKDIDEPFKIGGTSLSINIKQHKE